MAYFFSSTSSSSPPPPPFSSVLGSLQEELAGIGTLGRDALAQFDDDHHEAVGGARANGNSGNTGNTGKEGETGSRCVQWAAALVAFSSQYGNPSWAATNVCGPPRVYPEYGDRRDAWAPLCIGKKEFLEVKFDKVVFPLEVNVYETSAPGAIVSIWAKRAVPGEEGLKAPPMQIRSSGEWKEIWSGEPQTGTRVARIFNARFKLDDSDFRTDTLRLEMDGGLNTAEWHEIDAIQLEGNEFGAPERRELVRKPGSLNDHMFQLLEGNESVKDVEFQCEGNELISAHRPIVQIRCLKLIPAATSPDADWRTIIQLGDVSAEVFRVALEFLYTDDVIVPPKLSVPVCELARRLELSGLIELAVIQFNSLLRVHNAHKYLRIVREVGPLYDACIGFVARNVDQIDLETLEKSDLVKVIAKLLPVLVNVPKSASLA